MTKEDKKEKIKTMGLKHYWIAKQLGVSKQYFSNYLNGRYATLNPAQEQRLHAILEMDYCRT